MTATARHGVAGPPMDPIPRNAHLLRPLMDWAGREPDHIGAAYRDGDRFVDVTAADLYQRCRALAKGFVASGLQPGDRVALMSHTRLEWVLVDYAILAAGGVTVPIYETSSAEQIRWVVSDSGAKVLVVETPGMRELHESVAPALLACQEVVTIDDGGLEELRRRGESVADASLDDRIESITTDDLATIVYTSGTTGRPKGCSLTHGNLRTNVWQTLDALRPMLQADEVGLQFLPLAHSLAKIITLVGVEWGMKGAFATDLAHLPEEMAMVRPTMVAAVPRIFEKVFNSARQKAQSEGHGTVFDKAAGVAIEWSREHGRGGIHPITGAEHALFDRLVYRKVHDVFGGRLRLAFSGGGPLGERLTHFFNGVGVQVFEGYGLTETSPTLTVNRADAWQPGSVGRPVGGTAIKIAGDGEILAQGPQVFRGYWHNDAATAEIFDEGGWFKTGDVGVLDEQGYLYITGRKEGADRDGGRDECRPSPAGGPASGSSAHQPGRGGGRQPAVRRRHDRHRPRVLRRVGHRPRSIECDRRRLGGRSPAPVGGPGGDR